MSQAATKSSDASNNKNKFSARLNRLHPISLVPTFVLKKAADYYANTTVEGRVYLDQSRALIREGKPVIFVANHTWYTDTISIFKGLTTKEIRTKFVIAVNKSNYEKWMKKRIWRNILSRVDVRPVNFESPSGVKGLINASAKENKSIIIFPTGGHARHDIEHPGYPAEGAAFLAEQAKAPIQPANIMGAEHRSTLLSNRYVQLRRSPIKIKFLPLTSISPYDNHGNVASTPAEKKALRTNIKKHRKSEMERIMRVIPALGRDESLTMYDAFLKSVERYGSDKDILVDDSYVRATFGELRKKSWALASKFRSFGKPGEFVGIMPIGKEGFVASLLGLWANNQAAYPISPRSNLEAVESAVKATKMKHMLLSREVMAGLNRQDIIEKLKELGVKVHYLEDIRADLEASKVKTGLNVLWQLAAMRMTAKVSPDTPVLALSTSGTTGTPKTIVHSSRTFLYSLAATISTFDAMDQTVTTALPLSHILGMVALFGPMLHGVKANLHYNPLSRGLLELSKWERGTIMFSTPTILKQTLPFITEEHLNKVQVIITGGGPLDAETREKILAINSKIRIVQGYGSTEAGILALGDQYQRDEFAGTAGRILAGIELKMTPLDEGQPNSRDGTLQFKSPGTAMYYLDMNKPLQPQPLTDSEGYFNTKDIGSVDDERRVIILGRADGRVKIREEWVYLPEVEEKINSLFPGKKSKLATNAVYAAPAEGVGHDIIVFTDDATAAEPKAAMAKLTENKGKFLPNEVPTTIIYFKEFPPEAFTTTLKLREPWKKAAYAQYLASTLEQNLERPKAEVVSVAAADAHPA